MILSSCFLYVYKPIDTSFVLIAFLKTKATTRQFFTSLKMFQPEDLSQMALESLSSYVRQLCIYLAKICNKQNELPPESKPPKQIATQTCYNFYELFIHTIPPALADKISCTLLAVVDDWYANEGHVKMTGDSIEIMQQIVQCSPSCLKKEKNCERHYKF